ncbi:hypothetical protein KKA93_03430 [Patescibacteria group bacterium]|nr:hypothetical protein [Patescibacteria group bacterium]MBU1933659.1 hypothetical protein [Patescibacteria group bacterium]
MNVIKTYRTDWLASEPIFYNEQTGKVSENINEVIDFNNIEFHPEGLNNYLEFGYSVFEQTPIKNVKFLRHSSCIKVFDDNSIKVEYLPDPINQLLDKSSTENEVIDLLKSKINEWESKQGENIIIPTSGGYDSRLLTFLIQDKNKIESYTYGISNNQSQSYEVIIAKELTNRLGIKWRQIELGLFHNYFDEWDNLFGISTHAHGMYHMEFYNKISKITETRHLLSGIIGDSWAGSIKSFKLTSLHDLHLIGYTHGIKADVSESRLKTDYKLKKRFWEEHKDVINQEKYQVVWLIRFKMILLSYLIRVPKYLGFKPWSPFLDIEVAMKMLNLSQKKRLNRLWQKDFFKKNNINFEEKHNLKYHHENTLDFQAMKNVKLKPLNSSLFKEIINTQYIEHINSSLLKLDPNILQKIIYRTLRLPKIGGGLRMLGANDFKDSILNSYNAYLTLKPIENILIKRKLKN